MRARRSFLLLAVGVGLTLAACAEVGRPPGGPVDRTPPSLVTVEPGSLVTGVDLEQPLRFEFSEKIDRRSAARALTTVPRLVLESPDFDDLSVIFEPTETWPPDTVVVWTLTTSLRDDHGVALEEEIRGAFTSAESFPPGRITGQASLKPDPTLPDTAKAPEVDWTQLRAELDLPPPEGSRISTRWRTADGDETGRFTLRWLDVPSGPYDLTVYLDRNGNARRDEREPIAELDSLFLGPADSTLTLDESDLVLIDREGPVPLRFRLVSVEIDTLDVVFWARGEVADRSVSSAADTLGHAELEVPPGRVSWGAWVDLVADGRFGPDSLGVSEPFLPPDTVEVAPATAETLGVRWPDSTLTFDAVDTLRNPPVPADLQIVPPAPE